MLLRRIVPGDIVKVVVDRRVAKLRRIADDCVKIALGGREEIGVVHQYSAREIVPSPYAELDELVGKHHPSRT